LRKSTQPENGACLLLISFAGAHTDIPSAQSARRNQPASWNRMCFRLDAA
jgi:hypothetical protein